jgi:hypothetical protein
MKYLIHILLLFQVSVPVLYGSLDCRARCDPNKKNSLYPFSFSVYGAWKGRQYGTGETAFIIARFPASLCLLPEPRELGPDCIPQLSVEMRSLSDAGDTCLSIPAANSTRRVEIQYGIKFDNEYILETGENMNFWAFPLDVHDGMYTSQLKIVGFTIPDACNIPGRVGFNTRDLIPKGNRLLTPNVSVDTWPPTILNVYTGTRAGSYTFLDVIKIIVFFSKPVYFSELPSKFDSTFMKANASYTIPAGLPYLELNSQAMALLEGYAAGSLDRRKLSFVYIVGTGEYTPAGGQLEVPAGGTIQLNAGIIASVATGMEADLTTMPLPGTFGSSIRSF